MSEDILIDGYKFDNFRFAERSTSTVLFDFMLDSENEVTSDDKQKIMTMLCEMGKWESVIKTGFILFSELGIRHIEPATLQQYEKPSGAELYEISLVERQTNPYFATCKIHLKADELQRRQHLNVNPVFTSEEVANQIKNIPKWKAFEKTLNILKEQWTTR
jgi:hypothetical protein